jgi:hypothetical protein
MIEHWSRDPRKDRQIIEGLLQEGGDTANFITLTVRDYVRELVKHPEYAAPIMVKAAVRVDAALRHKKL